jgi:hypothetical protein
MDTLFETYLNEIESMINNGEKIALENEIGFNFVEKKNKYRFTESLAEAYVTAVSCDMNGDIFFNTRDANDANVIGYIVPEECTNSVLCIVSLELENTLDANK